MKDQLGKTLELKDTVSFFTKYSQAYGTIVNMNKTHVKIGMNVPGFGKYKWVRPANEVQKVEK